jgi:methylthioribulose-1-phosphate dehydratase
MSNSIAPNDPRALLAAHAKTFYDRGWMWGTAGNLSARLPEGSFWITASGCSKGELTPEQFVRMSLDGDLLERPTPQAKPSAETSIHQAVYGLFPEAKACYHVHSVPANLVSRLSATPQILLPAIEMRDRFRQSPPQIPACLIQDHGVTVWGASPAETRNRVEVMEFIFQYAIAAQSIYPQRVSE